MSRFRNSLVALVAAASLVGVAQADLITGLVGLWTFENSANLADDTSTYDNDGTVIPGGGSITQGPGVIGAGAAEMFATDPVGSNHYIEIPNAPQLNGTSQTVSYWIKTDYVNHSGEASYVDHIRHSGHMSFKTTGQWDTPGGWAPVTFDGSGGFGNSFLTQDQGGNNIGQDAWTGDGQNPGYADGQWHHIVTVYDEITNTVRSWIDGEQVVYQMQGHLIGGGLNASTDPLRIGGWDGWGTSLVGAIDQVRIYNVAKPYDVDPDGTLIGGDVYDMYMEIPEPASLLLLAIAGLVLRRR